MAKAKKSKKGKKAKKAKKACRAKKKSAKKSSKKTAKKSAKKAAKKSAKKSAKKIAKKSAKKSAKKAAPKKAAKKSRAEESSQRPEPCAEAGRRSRRRSARTRARADAGPSWAAPSSAPQSWAGQGSARGGEQHTRSPDKPDLSKGRSGPAAAFFCGRVSATWQSGLLAGRLIRQARHRTPCASVLSAGSRCRSTSTEAVKIVWECNTRQQHSPEPQNAQKGGRCLTFLLHRHGGAFQIAITLRNLVAVGYRSSLGAAGTGLF